MTNKEPAIIIPVFNEEKTIGNVLKKIKNKGSVFVIDDNSILLIPNFEPDFWIYAERSSKNILFIVELDKMILKFKSFNNPDSEFKALKS